ncbi:hypothetical protein BDV95DRAFT_489451 [Massariosphaeria phaeospora]|uniref:NAD(P)-binding protein n=1 Tax=Massariosphaeria phaeospora TaxID=100035 RepID=A0A7C8IDW3_9PLEO|nr:hypothetical protein BDV95DRAFT_489451 [Massariosphaeria phaeospora]
MSSSIESSIVFITGGNRGLGRGLVSTYLLRPATTVIAGVRNPLHELAQSLQQLPVASGSRIIVIEADVASTPSMQTAIQSLASQGIDRLDLVIANAALTPSKLEPLLSTPSADIEQMTRTNGLGILNLYRETQPLLLNSASPTPAFVHMAALTGSNKLAQTALKSFPMGAFGGSKALGHFFVTKLAGEEQNQVLIFNLDPGEVRSETYLQLRGDYRGDDRSRSPEESAKNVCKIIDGATKESCHGKFLNEEGAEAPF